MLRELKVEQLALIEGVSVRFEPGFNVLTGETGAGKSLLIDALGLAIGGRASAGMVRDGAGEAVVEALFEPDEQEERDALDAALDARGIPSAGGVMVVRRVIDAGGRHRVHVNGSLATVGTLGEICEGLVAVCGQHEHVTLTRPGEAKALLDAYAKATDPTFASFKDAYHAAWLALEDARHELEALEIDPAARAEREDFIRFQLSELDALAPRPGEIEGLETERRVLAGAEKLREITATGEAALYGADDAVSVILARVLRRLEEAAALDPGLKDMVEQLGAAVAVVSETGRDLGEYARAIDADPAALEKLEGRLAALKRLARRHGGDLEAACASAEALRRELEAMESHEARLEEARAGLEEAEARAARAAAKLSRGRKAAARRLDDAVRAGLERLCMAESRVSLRVRDEGSLGIDGSDRVEVGLAAEPDAPLRPISKVASGGELSRLLLAFRRAIADVDGVATAVFDEVDAGIGGGVAEAVGRLMGEVAEGRQVLCVTHLPQLAARATHHLVVTKDVRRGRAEIAVSPVSGGERVEEVARMLGGADSTRSTRAHAMELVQAGDSPPDRPLPASHKGARGGRERRRSRSRAARA